MYYATKNLVDSSSVPCKPWEFDGLSRVPKNALADKAERERWLQNPQTEFQCFTAFEGVNNQLRISGLKSEDGNPPAFMHGLVVDYDTKLLDVEIEAGLNRMGNLKANRVERSLSGNARLHWHFERPLPLASGEFTRFLLKNIHELIPVNQLGGLDRGALEAPERLYTNGCQWREVHSQPIAWTLLLGFMLKMSQKFAWRDCRLGPCIPYEIAAKALAEKYPRFSEWQGDFKEHSQGPSFWVDGSTSPKSALVLPHGLHTFAGHAHKNSFLWSELLGHEFVKQYQLTELGRAADGVFFDGVKFIRKTVMGGWLYENRDDFSQFLRTERGLSDRREKGDTFCAIDSAVMHVKNTAHVEGAATFAFFPKGIMVRGGKRYLNTHSRDVLQPAAELTPWGPDGKFPWISKFLDKFFSTDEQLPYCLSWCSHFYKGCYHRSPSPGQNIILVGDPGLGKTFFMRRILGEVMAGCTEAKEYLMGQTIFNGDLFDYALWVMDDASIAQGPGGGRRYAEMLKRMSANDSFWMNEKYRKGSMVFWSGRIMVSCNPDAESRRMVPDTELSNREKLSLFLINSERNDGFRFPTTRPETNQIVDRELPHFAKFLLEFRTPDHCIPEDGRFGVAHYHEPSLSSSANQSSESGVFAEILDEFLRHYFTVRSPGADSFCGTALQLHKEIHQDPTVTEAMRPYTVRHVGRYLSQLAERGVFKVVMRGDEHRRLFEIYRGTRFPKKPVATPPPTGDNSAFQKPTT